MVNLFRGNEMTRDEAIAPLGPNEGRFPIMAGAFRRGRLRHMLNIAMLDYYEEKSFFESSFIIRGSADKVKSFIETLKQKYG
jgi:hypothetical protein